MQLSLLQENLNTALQHVSRFVASKSQLPILGNILLATDSGRLRLSATNLELGINYWIGAKIEVEGSLTVPAKDLTEYVSYLPSGKLDLSVDDHGLLTLHSSKSDSTFATQPPADYPLIPSLPDTSVLELDYATFATSIPQIVFASATDDSRPILTGVRCQFTPNSLLLVATDGFRLSLKHLQLSQPLTLPDTSELTFILPSKTLVEIAKLAKTTKTLRLGLTPDGHQLVFAFDDVEIASRLLEGDFPDYNRIIPQTFATKVHLDRLEFAQNIKIASVFARQSANVVKLKIKPDSVEFTANATQVGKNSTTLDARVEGNPLEIAFNYKFVSDFLTACPDSEIILELNEALTPALFHGSDSTFTHIIMPVRLQD